MCMPFRVRWWQWTRCRVSERLSNCQYTKTISRIFSKMLNVQCGNISPWHDTALTFFRKNCISDSKRAQNPCRFAWSTVQSRRFSSGGLIAVRTAVKIGPLSFYLAFSETSAHPGKILFKTVNILMHTMNSIPILVTTIIFWTYCKYFTKEFSLF